MNYYGRGAYVYPGAYGVVGTAILSGRYLWKPSEKKLSCPETARQYTIWQSLYAQWKSLPLTSRVGEGGRAILGAMRDAEEAGKAAYKEGCPGGYTTTTTSTPSAGINPFIIGGVAALGLLIIGGIALTR